jgi:hypothetical protein
MLVYVRPSNEALLRARVPGAQDRHGCPLPILFIVGALRARRAPGHSHPRLIIGTGPGEGTLAYKLAPSGKNIPLLE